MASCLCIWHHFSARLSTVLWCITAGRTRSLEVSSSKWSNINIDVLSKQSKETFTQNLSIFTWHQIHMDADARHRGRRRLVLTVGCMFLMVVWEGTGVPGGNWLTLGRAACAANRGQAFCTGSPDSGRVGAGFLRVPLAIVPINNMSRVNKQSVALTKGLDVDLACAPRVPQHRCCTLQLWNEWVPLKFPLQISAVKNALWILRYVERALVDHFFFHR